MLHVPFRGGVRGGKDQFTWESVKNDKDREYYLGHSLKAPVGRWQKGKDIQWYANDKSIAQQAKNEEFLKAKELEDQALMARLGYKVVDKPKEEPRSRSDDSEGESESEPEERSKRDSKKKDSKSKVSGPSSLSSNEKKKLDDMLKKLVKKNGLDKVLKALIVESDDDGDEENSHKKSKKNKKHKSKKKSEKKESSSDESSEDESRYKKRSDLKRKHSRERDYESKRTTR